MTPMLDIDDVLAAEVRLRPYVHRTPIATCRTIDGLAGFPCYFKCENFQKVGAFKYRGATNAVLQLDPAQASRGVCTHSSGNHAQALALAAAERNIPAVIVMPQNSPRVKVDAVRGYGAEIVFCPPTQADREAAAARIVEERGAVFVHPYDHPHVIAGQGTTALEILDEQPEVNFIVPPIGGGGLASGCCLAATLHFPDTLVLGAEPAGADDAFRSLESGVRQPMLNPETIADGLRTGLGRLTFPILKQYLHSIVTVSDEEIVRAMELLWTRMKLVVEPSGAVPLAAVLSPKFPRAQVSGGVAIILSGGNVDLRSLPFSLSASSVHRAEQ